MSVSAVAGPYWLSVFVLTPLSSSHESQLVAFSGFQGGIYNSLFNQGGCSRGPSLQSQGRCGTSSPVASPFPQVSCNVINRWGAKIEWTGT